MVGQTAYGEEAVRVIADVSPDVVVMHVMMPKKDEVETCGEIMEAAPETRVIMLMGSTGEEVVTASAPGCNQKETDRERLLPAVRKGLLGD